MSVADWLIVILPLLFLLGIAVYSQKYARGVADFMAAGRVAGRYIISVGDLTAGLSVISLVAGAEQAYQMGYGVGFWNKILAPIGVVLALTGFCTYRWRETRCLSRGQFIELRYGSRFFRIVTAVISTTAEMITNAIGPAIAANFFIYFLKLPHEVMICGINLPCYVIIVAMCLALAVVFIWPSGRISLLLTDGIQGILCYPIFVIFTGFILLKFSWNIDIADVMFDRVPGQSFMNPYDVAQLRDFNIFALIVTLMSSVINRAAWIGNDTTNSGRTPHEQKMAGVLGAWRNGFAYVLILLLAVMTIAFMNGSKFAVTGGANQFRINSNQVRKELSVRILQKVVPDKALREQAIARVNAVPEQIHRVGIDTPLSQKHNLDTTYYQAVQEVLGSTPEGRIQAQEFRSVFQQMLMPTVLRGILPGGMLGLFCLLMIMLMISTDDSRLFNSAGALVQDMILPVYSAITGKRLEARHHLLLLRLTTVTVAVFFFFVALVFRNLDYINMFTTIMCAFWLGGSGPIMVFGLYSRFGNLTGAWCAIVFGSGTSLLGLIGQQTWASRIYPFLETHGWAGTLDRQLRLLSSPFEPWVHWQVDPFKFPLNSFEIFFISMILALVSYIIGSFLTYKPYNLDKLLHRGKYADGPAPQKISWSLRTVFGTLIGITPEYTRSDRWIAWSVFIYTFIYQLFIAFVCVVICNLFFEWPRAWWNRYFYIVYLIVPSIAGVITTVWFMWGGLHDLRQLFIDLKNRTEDENDNGQVLDSDKIQD